VEGVEDVDVDYSSKKVTVKTNGKVDAQALTAAFEGTKYSATVE